MPFSCLPPALILRLLLSTCTLASPKAQSTAGDGEPSPVRRLLGSVTRAGGRAEQLSAYDSLLAIARAGKQVLTTDSTAIFLYEGNAGRVQIAGDFNGWSPTADSLRSLGNGRRWYLEKGLPPASRVEYKFVVDSNWILDPLNAMTAAGGFGENSEIRMPGYTAPRDLEPLPGVPRGRIDTLIVASSVLGCEHPVYVYTPADTKSDRQKYPSLIVTDGGEFLSLAKMNVVLDNLIAEMRMPPVIAIFVDPRTRPGDAASNRRMTEYAMNERFVSFLSQELLPKLRRTYPLADAPESTAIAGASMGGLIAAYASFRDPSVFGLCAAQSPSLWWAKDSMLTLLRSSEKKPIRFYIDTGTLHDALPQSRKMRDILTAKGYDVSYGEYPEGHNWSNWRSRFAALLTFFWGKH